MVTRGVSGLFCDFWPICYLPQGLPAFLSWLPWEHPYFRKQSDSVRVEEPADEALLRRLIVCTGAERVRAWGKQNFRWDWMNERAQNRRKFMTRRGGCEV